MIKQLICLVILSLFSTIYCADPKQTACASQNNTDCDKCLNIKNCAFCKADKSCFYYDPKDPINPPCHTDDMQWQTCVGNFRVWIIVVAVILGIVLITIFIVVCCLCRKCKKCRIRKEERRQDRDDQRMEERRQAAEVRTAERNRVADQIRMKYGILKENDQGPDYARMS